MHLTVTVMCSMTHMMRSSVHFAIFVYGLRMFMLTCIVYVTTKTFCCVYKGGV